ncbi:MAG: MraY family glycosyltransferase [Chloroflexi bacterium]|nr:MraY family glycosyltransferase [Chloroflexota bacterium]
MLEIQPFVAIGALAFVTAGLVSYVLSHVAVRIGWRTHKLHLPGPGRIHDSPVVRFGGIAILPAFLLALLFTSPDPESLIGISLCSVLIAGIGLADDVWNIPPLGKLAGQCTVSVAAVLAGVQIAAVSNPFGGVIELDFAIGSLLTVFWLVGMMNAINLLDGLDGLAPGVVFVAALILSFLSAQLGNDALALFGLALAGSVAGFLPLNVRKAKLILGDSGSNLLGFLIGVLAVLGQAKIGTALLVLGIPILDVGWAIVRRYRSGHGIMSRDTEHLHHRLLDAGLTRTQVTIVYVVLCASFGASALFLERAEKLIALAVLIGLTAIMIYVGAKRAGTKR